MAFINGRLLHFVFKIADRKLTDHFYRNILGMKILRHEEFDEGCEAACNGPYANRWSKTMIGYGHEDENFVIELTYNYPIKSYNLGNDFIGITIKSKDILVRAKFHNWPILPGNVIEAPGGYKYFIVNEDSPANTDCIQKVSIACSDIEKSLEYWVNILGLNLYEKWNKSFVVGFQENATKIELKEINEPIDRGTAYGRIAFSCSKDDQLVIEKKIKDSNNTILTPLLTLDTPGKASVRVIILGDVDGHEICFADDAAFRQLSQIDSDAESFLEKNIESDKTQSV